MSHEHSYSIALFCWIKRLSEHLNGLDLTFLLNLANLNLIPNFYLALGDSSSDNTSFSLYFEAVINE